MLIHNMLIQYLDCSVTIEKTKCSKMCFFSLSQRQTESEIRGKIMSNYIFLIIKKNFLLFENVLINNSRSLCLDFTQGSIFFFLLLFHVTYFITILVSNHLLFLLNKSNKYIK